MGKASALPKKKQELRHCGVAEPRHYWATFKFSRHCGLDPQSHSLHVIKKVAFTLAEGASHGAVSYSNRKVAFTLAEVLITLGIIGVVAAMTLPAVINKTQDNILKQQFKKTYSTFSNALMRTYANNGGIFYECYYADYTSSTCTQRNEQGECIKYENVVGFNHNSECNKLFDELKTILKVVKICDNNALRNGCVSSDMKGIDTTLKANNENFSDRDVTASTSGCAAFREQNIKNNNPTWVMSDGTIIGFYPSDKLGKIFWIDINGHKKPNKWGYDIFTFSLKGNSQKVKLAPGGCFKSANGGKTPEEMMELMYK